MQQNFDTTLGVYADANSSGQPVDFDGAFVSNLTITNNSGLSVQYSADSGLTWTGLSAGGSAFPSVPDSTAFFVRKMASGGQPVPVRLTWRSRDSLDPSSVDIRGGVIGRTYVGAGAKSTAIDQGASLGRVTSLRVPSLARNLLATYRANIVAAGDTVTNAELDALHDPLDRLMRSTVWPKLRELWVPCGTSAIAGALVKLKADASSSVNMTHTGLVAGDYTALRGITGDAVGKWINTGFNPTTAGVAATDWGFGAYCLNISASGVLAGAGNSTNATYIGQTTGDSKINGVQVSGALSTARLQAVQITGGQASAYYGGAAWKSVNGAGQTGLTNTNIGLLHYDTGFYSNESICGYAAWTPGLTDSEMKELSNFFDAANMALYRNAWQPTYVVVGDSNSAGFGVTSAQRWSALLAKALGATEDNQGINGSTMSASDNGGASDRWITNHKFDKTLVRAGSFYTVMLGTNDDRYAVSPGAFASDYEAWLNVQFAGGIDPSQMILMSPIAAFDALSSSTRQLTFGATVAALAAKYGCGFFDTYPITVGQPSYFQGDSLHLSVAGHIAFANAALAYVASQTSATTLRRAAA